MQQQGVVLRIKRHRHQQAPEQIVLEATSRNSALLSDFQRSVAIRNDTEVTAETQAAAEPPRKRCRFVLLKPVSQDTHVAQLQASQQQQQSQRLQQPSGNAAAAAVPPGSRVLDLWHSSGLKYTPANAPPAAAAAAAAAGSSVMGGRTKQQQKNSPSAAPVVAAAAAAGSGSQLKSDHSSAMGLQKGVLYESMVHEYLQQQHEPAAARVRQTHKPPSRRAARSHAAAAAAAGTQPPQAASTAHKPNPLPLLPLPAAVAAAQGVGSNMLIDGEQPEYVYDMYIPVYDDSMMDHTDLYQQQQGGDGGGPTVVQVWEEDLADFADLWPVQSAAAAAAAVDDDEDSNAEDYYANDYPDEDDHQVVEAGSEADNDLDGDSSDNPYDDNDNYKGDNDSLHNVHNTLTNGQSDSLITSYKPNSVKLSKISAGVNDDVGTEEYDMLDYESSGDEEELQGWYNSGAAWRAVLAEQCMLQDGDEP